MRARRSALVDSLTKLEWTTVTVVVLTYGFDQFDVAQVLLGVLLVPAGLEAFVGFCIGCQIFGWLMRAGVVPDDVCEACNDIWSRRPDRPAAAT